MCGGIYKIENIKTGDTYIGQTKDFEQRKKRHFSNLKNNKHINYKLQDDVLKYGIENFEFNILEKENDVFKRDYLESYYYEKYNPKYNIVKLKNSNEVKETYDNYYEYKKNLMKIIDYLIKNNNYHVFVEKDALCKKIGLYNENQFSIFNKCFDYDNNYNFNRKWSINLLDIKDNLIEINIINQEKINKASGNFFIPFN